MRHDGRVLSVDIIRNGQGYRATFVVEGGLVRANLAGTMVTRSFSGTDPESFVRALLEDHLLACTTVTLKAAKPDLPGQRGGA